MKKVTPRRSSSATETRHRNTKPVLAGAPDAGWSARGPPACAARVGPRPPLAPSWPGRRPSSARRGGRGRGPPRCRGSSPVSRLPACPFAESGSLLQVPRVGVDRDPFPDLDGSTVRSRTPSSDVCLWSTGPREVVGPDGVSYKPLGQRRKPSLQ